MPPVNPTGLLPDATRLGTLHLNVKDRPGLSRFYQDALGLAVQREDSRSTWLGAGREDLLCLTEAPDAPAAHRHATLYHFCLAVEKREDLGWWLRRLTDRHVELQGLVDHRMAEAVYLEDPEGNGLELNWDRPRSQWRPWSEWLAMGNAPLDVEGLLAADDQAGPRAALARDTRVGHIHLHVGDLVASEKFFCGALGLAKTAEVPGQVIFSSAGGYHHHVAFNVWKGRGVAPQPLGALGLGHVTLVVPKASDVAAVQARLQAGGYTVEVREGGVFTRDPSGHGLWVQAEG